MVSGTEATEYTYDTLGRLVASTTSVSNTMRTQLWQEFNENNQLSKQVLNFVDKSYTMGYTYDSYGRLTQYTLANPGNKQNSDTVSQSYDALSRVSSVTTPVYVKTYSYDMGKRNLPSGQPGVLWQEGRKQSACHDLQLYLRCEWQYPDPH